MNELEQCGNVQCAENILKINATINFQSITKTVKSKQTYWANTLRRPSYIFIIYRSKCILYKFIVPYLDIV